MLSHLLQHSQMHSLDFWIAETFFSVYALIMTKFYSNLTGSSHEAVTFYIQTVKGQLLL